MNTARCLKQVCCLGIGMLGVIQTHAQSIVSTKDTAGKSHQVILRHKRPKPISKELSVGFRLNTDGWSVFADRGKVLSDDPKLSEQFYDTRVLQLEFGEHKHPREYRNTNGQIATIRGDKPKPYIYGKINNFYDLKFGYGKRKMIAGKPDPGNISIHWVYMGGLSIGLLKPYYIDAYINDERKSVKYSEDIKDDFLNPNNIVGASGWSKGIGETRIIPGIHAKTALHFDFAASANTKLALEAGVTGALYIQKIEIMADQKASPFLFNAYVSLQFGGRWR